MILANTAATGMPLAILAYTPGRPLTLQTLMLRPSVLVVRDYYPVYQRFNTTSPLTPQLSPTAISFTTSSVKPVTCGPSKTTSPR